MTDRYRQRLASAKWTWREGSHGGRNQGKLRKDRESGRYDKRGARAEDRREIEIDRG